MKKRLEFIKGLVLIALLFVSAGVVVASDDPDDDIHTVSVTVTQASTSENGEDPVTNDYEKEVTTTGPTDVQVSSTISGDKASLTTNLGDTDANKDDTTTVESDDTLSMPEFEVGKSPEKFNEELSLWISSIIDDIDLLTIEDL